MALTFPRAMPTGGVSTQYFEIDRLDIRARSGARLGGVELGFPLWKMALSIGPTDQDEGAEWRAFVASLRGALRLFYAQDLTRPYPRNYANGFTGLSRAGGGTFDGSASSWSVNADRDALTLNGLPAAFSISLGDYVGFRWGDHSRTLVRAVEAVAADGSGVATFAVEPPLPTATSAGAQAYLDNPTCLMRLDPDQTSLGDQDAALSLSGTIVAMQDIDP